MTNREAIFNLIIARRKFERDYEELKWDFDATPFDMAIEALEERKTGRWIRHPIYEGSDHYYYACSECDYRSWSKDNFCSVCGAKMGGEEDE